MIEYGSSLVGQSVMRVEVMNQLHRQRKSFCSSDAATGATTSVLSSIRPSAAVTARDSLIHHNNGLLILVKGY